MTNADLSATRGESEKTMKNMFFVQNRSAYDEEVNTYAFNCYYNMSSVEELNTEKCLSVEELMKDYINCAKEVEDRIDPDFHLKTEEEAWETLEDYDYANYGIFSVEEFAEGVREIIKNFFEEAEENDEG